MEAKSYSKNLKISPKKLRFLLPEIKKMSPSDALVSLLYMPQKPAKIFYKTISSAIANAKNVLKVDEKLLKFKHLSVEQGNKIKRFRAGGRGTAKPILRRFAHIKIVLETEEPKTPEVPKSSAQSLQEGKQVTKKSETRSLKSGAKIEVKNKKIKKV